MIPTTATAVDYPSKTLGWLQPKCHLTARVVKTGKKLEL